jgi:hypothetical protein
MPPVHALATREKRFPAPPGNLYETAWKAIRWRWNQWQIIDVLYRGTHVAPPLWGDNPQVGFTGSLLGHPIHVTQTGYRRFAVLGEALNREKAFPLRTSHPRNERVRMET